MMVFQPLSGIGKAVLVWGLPFHAGRGNSTEFGEAGGCIHFSEGRVVGGAELLTFQRSKGLKLMISAYDLPKQA